MKLIFVAVAVSSLCINVRTNLLLVFHDQGRRACVNYLCCCVADVVGTVVSVWAEVGRWCLTPAELSQFLALFKASAPPVVSTCQFVLLVFSRTH